MRGVQSYTRLSGCRADRDQMMVNASNVESGPKPTTEKMDANLVNNEVKDDNPFNHP